MLKKIDQTSPKIAVIFKLCQILPINSNFANNYKAFEKKFTEKLQNLPKLIKICQIC